MVVKKFGPIMQMGFVVEDLDTAINFWTKKMNVGPFIKLEGIELYDQYYNHESINLDFSGALSYTGTMQIELIKQHCNTPSIYNEYVNNKKDTLHHLCALTNDIENDIKILESEGYKNLQGGRTQDNGKFAYLDTTEKGKPIFELTQLSEGGIQFFKTIEKASFNWDKKTTLLKTEIIL